MSSTPAETDPTGPAFEFNWGAASQLATACNSALWRRYPFEQSDYLPGGVACHSAYGLTDTETGAKIRFVQETKHRPQVGIYPMLELPTGSYSRGLGVGKVWYKLPVWIQKSWGEWTSYGGAGYQVVPQHEYRNFLYAGWLLQRNIGKKLTLGGELFSHQKEGFAVPQTQSATLVDFGGAYSLRIPACSCCLPMDIR